MIADKVLASPKWQRIRRFVNMAEGRRSQVVLLDDRRLDILVQPKLYAGDLLDMVSSHFNLKEKEYFGLAYLDETGHYNWLQMDRRVLEHEFPKKFAQGPGPLVLYFLVKYFVEHITQLRDSSTVEAFYLQAKSLVAKGSIEVDSETAFQLAALVLQATHGDYTDDSTAKNLLKKLPVLPTSVFKEHPSLTICEDRVAGYYKKQLGQSRGSAIVKYMSLVETLPTYGIHYYQVKDKGSIPWWLGLSHRGLSQYDFSDRKTPRKVFLWKQLENLYFRDRKFSIEVHDAKRVVHTLSSFNLYEDAIEEPPSDLDELSDAICDPTTQVSVSRRTFGPGNVTVLVWLAQSPSLTKCIWSMAIAQHQFYLDRKHNKSQVQVPRNLGQIAAELSASTHSLSSSASSTPRLSRSASAHSLPALKIEGDGVSEEGRQARAAMLAALKAKRDALEEALLKKTADLKAICLREGELTGELPPETPLSVGEPPPQVRRRVGTSFMLNDKLILCGQTKEEEIMTKLELNIDIQSKIASAAWKLANDVSAKKSVRRQRKITYQQAQVKLKELEKELIAKKKQVDMKKRLAARQMSDDERSEDNISHSTDGSGGGGGVNEKCYTDSMITLQAGLEDANNHINRVLTVSVGQNSSNCPSPVPSSNSSSVHNENRLLSRNGSISAPASPTKHRHNSQTTVSSSDTPPASPVCRVTDRSFDGQGYKPNGLYQTRQSYRNQHYPTLPLNGGGGSSATSRTYSTGSEYDNISIDNANCAMLKSPYQNRFEASLNTEGSNLYSVSTQRTSQALDSKDDIILPSPTPKTEPENFGLMSRHNSLDSMRRHSYQRLNSQPQSPAPQSPVSKKPQSPLPPQQYHNQSHTLPTSMSYDERLSMYPKTRQQQQHDANEQHNAARLRHQSSFNSSQQFKHPGAGGGGTIETVNPVYQHQFSSLHRQVQRVRSGNSNESRSLDRLDCDDYPVFEDNYLPNSLRGGGGSNNTIPRDGITVTYLPPPGKPRLKHSKSGDVSSRMNSLPRPSTLNVQNSEDGVQRSDNLQRHGSVSGLSNGSSKPVSVVHPQLWLETSLDEVVGATASNVQSPKSRSKNWTETSLDSPLPVRRSKSKELGSTNTLNTLASMTANLDNLIAGRSVTPTTSTSTHSMSHPSSNDIQSSSIPEESKETTPTSGCPPTTTGRTSVVPPEFNYQNGPISGVPTVDVVSVGQFQPYWEETKPYELSDFYKYSTKHRNSSASTSSSCQNSPVKCNNNNSVNKKDDSSLQDVSNSPYKEVNCVGGATATRTQRELYYGSPPGTANSNFLPESPINKHLLSPTRVIRRANSPALAQSKSPNVMSPDGSFTFDPSRMSVVDDFHEEMIAWYEDQENVKRATLV